MRPGFLTSEFWLHLGAAVWGAVAPGLPPLARAACPVLSAIAYGIGRVLVKRGASSISAVGAMATNGGAP